VGDVLLEAVLCQDANELLTMSDMALLDFFDERVELAK
jgi:hypothetical protein